MGRKLFHLAWHGLWQCLPSAPGLSQKQVFCGFTHCPQGGDSRTCCPHGQRARVQVSWQGPVLSLCPCKLCPTCCCFSFPACKSLSLTHLFLYVSCGRFFGLTFLLQERCVSGTGKPVLCLSSDPPVKSHCLKLEEPTPSPSPPLKRQVGLLPVAGGLAKAEGTLLP